MAERRTLICDVCGAEEDEAKNGSWFGVVIRELGAGSRRMLQLFPLGARGYIHLGEDRLEHVCGATCATRKVSEFLGRSNGGAR